MFVKFFSLRAMILLMLNSSLFSIPVIREIPLAYKPDDFFSLTGNGQRFLLVKQKRRFSLYSVSSIIAYQKQRKNLKASYYFKSPKGASVFDLYDLNGDGQKDLIFYNGKEICIRLFKGLALSPCHIYPYRSNVFFSTSDNIFHYRFIFKPHRAHKPIMLIPQVDRIDMIEFDDQTLSIDSKKYQAMALSQKITLRDSRWEHTDLRSYTLKTTIDLPKFQFLDFDGDHNRDIIIRRRKKIIVFKYQKGQWTKKTINPYLGPISSYASHVEVHDLNHNGFLDAVFSYIKGSGLSISTRTYVILDIGKKGRKKKRIDIDGGLFFPFHLDLTYDSLLLFPQIDIGVSLVLSYFFQNTIPLTLQIYRVGAQGIRKMAPLSFSPKVVPGFYPTAIVGNFLGDPRQELFLTLDSQTMIMYRHTDGQWKKAGRFLIKGYGKIKVLNLNGNRYDDIAIRYQGYDRKRGYSKRMITVVLF